VEQPTLEGMPKRLYACTPTRLQTWLDCPRRYRMTYLDRPQPPKGPPWAHNSFGASVHNALAAWWRLRRPARTVAAAGDLLERGWIDEGYSGPAQSAGQRDVARQMVERYVAGLDPAGDPLGVERTVGTRTAQIAFSGRIDRLDGRRGPGGDRELVVVDYKTGRRPLSADSARSSLALALYTLAAERVLRIRCRRVELHHLPTASVHAWEHSEASLDRQLRRAEGIAAECGEADERSRAGLAGAELDGVFPPRPGPGCGWCDFRALCPEGSAAGPAHKPWDGLGRQAEGELPAGRQPDGQLSDGERRASYPANGGSSGNGRAGE
jgi:RecB family exonuclease